MYLYRDLEFFTVFLLCLGRSIAVEYNFEVECIDSGCDKDVERYDPNWESLDSRPLPVWYDDAKVGIFVHWGVYSVPCFGSEWFWTNWKGQNVSSYVAFMQRNYHPSFTYQDFAKDFKAELFNATQWAELFQASGAKYVVLTSKHHDGYTLWPSSRSFSWNAVDVGPAFDIINEFSKAIRQHTSLRFGLYYSLFEWFNRMYLQDKLLLFFSNSYVENKMIPELREIVKLYRPEIVWSDGDWEAPAAYWQSKEFLAWLYNDSPVRDTVVTNDRWGLETHCLHGDFKTCSDRYNPGVLQRYKFENAFTIDKTSWGQRYDSTLKDFLTDKEIIKEIVTTVSCGGNVLINVGPTSYGTIQPIFEERLRNMGQWLDINGEAIYGTRPWLFQNDTVNPNVWYTSKTDKTGSYVYAMVLEYPYETGKVSLSALRRVMNAKADVELLGLAETHIAWTLNDTFVEFTFPDKRLSDKNKIDHAWTFKITLK